MLCALSGGFAGCQGQIDRGSAANGGAPFAPSGGDTGAGSNPSGSGSNAGNGSGSGTGATAGVADPRIAERIWRLTPAQLNDEVKRLFGDAAPEIDIPDSAGENGLTNIAANAVVDLGNASSFADGARSVASWVVAQAGAATRCSNYGSDQCVDSFLGWFPKSAFRRPVSSAELAELRALFDELRADYDYDYAFGGLVRAVLLSPDFLYRTELGDGSGTLTGPEIANLLAFAITDHSPDDQLLAVAEKEDLTDPDVREREARRLMAKSERIWQRFFWEWLQMSTLYSQGEEVGLDPKLVADMEEEYRAFVSEVVVTEHGSLRDVLSAPFTFAQPELAAFYGAKHPGSGLARVELDPTERGGLLTQGAWLVSHGKRGRDNVVRRGMNIYRQAMCNDISPPLGVDVQAELRKLVGPDASVRETVDARDSAPSCGGCHKVADPVGIVFESFASDGSFQTRYPDGKPVDTAGEVSGIGSFDSAPELSRALADDLGFQRCFVQRFTHFLLGIDLGSPTMVALSQQAHERLIETDTSLEELLVSIVRHPAFIERRMEDGT